MFRTFFNFEIKTWLKAPMPWIFLLVIGFLSFSATISDNVMIGGSYGNIYKNAPYVAMNWYAVFSIITILLVAAFINSAAIRDFERQTSQIVFSKPISKAAYYFGHFFGAVLVAMIPLLGVGLGMYAGFFTNPLFDWLDPARFGPFEIKSHVMAFLIFVIPNTFFIGAVLYVVAVKTRSTIYPFVAAAAILVIYIVAQNVFSDVDEEWIASLIDPFGGETFGNTTKYWTIDEKNTLVPGLTGMILINRLIWIAAGIVALLIGYRIFDFSEKKKKTKKKELSVAGSTPAIRFLGTPPKFTPRKGFGVELTQLWSQYRTEVMGILKSTAFILLALLGLLNCIPNLIDADDSYGTHELPVTYSMVNIIRGTFYLFSVIIMVYFSGFLVWKERNARMDEIYDALPVKNWTLYLGKLGAVLTILFLLHGLLIIAAVLTQMGMGYHQYNIGVYVRELLLMDMLYFLYVTVLSMLVHTLSKNMYLGFGIVVVLLLLFNLALPAMHISTNMLDFGDVPGYVLSDFYGYEPFLKGITWFHIYWFLFCTLLAVAAFLLWTRGRETGFKKRLSLARQEWGNYRMFGIAAGALFLASAGWTYYNTFILNSFNNSKESELLRVDYEKNYKHLTDTPQPRIYDVKFDIELYPETRSMTTNGKYWVRNKTDQLIDSLIVNVPNYGTFDLQNNRLELLLNDEDVYFRIYRIDPPMPPGDSLLLDFTTRFEPKGFENQVRFSKFVQNGLFFNNGDVAPSLGYQRAGELTGKNDRKEYGLPERTRMPELNRTDTLARMSSYISGDADWVHVETILRTAPDQIAIAPGSLVREWNEEGRRCFQYQLDQKAWNFYSFMSARYEVDRRDWNGIQLEVYHHPDHDFNVERMLNAMEKSLEYYTTHFGPYYHNQCRIIEFPRFSSFAQAFPGTMPYSESVGFIQDFKDKEGDLDMMFYVAAHEIGHQWWAHQECGAYMQGAEMTTETFAQYSALMVMEREYGRDQMRKFLKYEMDKYLRGRSRESEAELPLATCEGQGYAHYNKGSVVMYYLKEMIGEENVNAALRAFLEKFRYKPGPYPVSLDVIDEFYAYTPDSLDYIVKDLFEDITLFDNRCEEVSIEEMDDGKYKVTIQTSSKKFKSDDLGKTSEVPVNDYIEIGAFAKPEGEKTYGKSLYRERVKITSPENTFTFIVDEKPEEAGIDPFSLLIDRNPEDNLKEL